jgi:hypothetical protein
MLRVGLFLFLAFCLSACASVSVIDNRVGEDGRESQTHRYFGFVEVVVPKASHDIEAVRIQSAGIAIEQGLSIGWRETETVLVPLKVNEDGSTPDEATCSLVVIIRSGSEAAHAAELLRNIEGDGICTATFQ